MDARGGSLHVLKIIIETYGANGIVVVKEAFVVIKK